MIYISVKNKKILDNIIEIFDNNELKFCYDNIISQISDGGMK